MAHVITPKLQKVIDKVAAFAKSKHLSEFVTKLYSSVSFEDLNGFDAKYLFDSGASIFDLLKSKGNKKHAISYYKQSADSEYAVLEIVNDDAPFLVDSITNEFKLRQIDINLICHDMFVVKRDKKGVFECFDQNGSKEYVIQIHIPNRFHDEFSKHLIARIGEILECINLCVQDWRKMTSKMQEASDALSAMVHKDKTGIKDESVGFLEWLIANHLVFLGSAECKYTNGKLIMDEASKTGLLRSPLYTIKELPYEAEFMEDDFVIVRKWDSRSVVHRTAHMDVVLVKRYDNQGKAIGASVFFGLFTSTVYYQSVRNIPLMREKVNRVIDMYGYPETSHNCKELTTALESFPRGELLQMSIEELYHTATGIVSLSLIPRVKVFLRKDQAEKFVSCIIFIPEKKFSTETRVLIEGIVCHKLQGVVSKRYIQIGESSLTRLQLIVKLAGAKVAPNVGEEIEAEIVKAVSNWSDELYHALQKRYSKKVATTYYSRYAEAFGIKYKAVITGAKAVHDIKYIEQCIETNKVGFDIYVRDHEDKGPHAEKLHLKIYSHSKELALSSTLPMIENLGLHAIDVEMYDVLVNAEETKHHVYLYHFHLVPKKGHSAISDAVCAKAKEALCHIWDKKIDDDAFNALIIACDMDYTHVNILRAYVQYLKQTKYSLSVEYTIQVLLDYPEISKKFISLFCTMFDPKVAQKDRKKADVIVQEIKDSLNSIANINEDRAIQSLLGVFTATLRTNFYQYDKLGGHKTYISFKLRSSDIKDLPLPRPYAEVFVYSIKFEGIHLRGGRVARGGLRWSDRPEDFRTEVLGLMKAQMTKNSVIVPVGSKGGFIVKRKSIADGRDEYMAEGIECYKMFLCGLLDLTDNIVGDQIIAPENVVCRDDNDPYLVVAADKGTATFSDYANGVSADYNFWLGDAFASGGSVGYDHKKMGITAKGGWMSVVRHFEDMGVDISKEEFTCIGIGDMAGDVFGNGMLLSNKLKLVAAFNHAHIFIDPSPNAAKSFEERKRLFNKPRSQWTDYDTKLISKGGGVFDRKLKNIKLSPEARSILDISEAEMSPDDLINAILRAPVDLLWNGGIGTYVKSKSEANERIGDKANDNLRINGNQLRAKVVGEGGNLGFTQLGRIEYARIGGRLNTDFIDNSAGVDCSDHEVNIKIGIADAVRSKKLSRVDRDKFLEKMTSDVAKLVLQDNYKQTQIMTLEQQSRMSKINSHAWLMRHLEEIGELDRSIEFLPNEEELKGMIQEKRGLTRPEIAVLLAYSKNSALKLLNDCDLSTDAYLNKYLNIYFPKDFQTKFASYIAKHRLKKEIIATVLVNDFVNMLGCTFYHQLLDETGASPDDVIKAFVVVREVFSVDEYWLKIEQLGSGVTLDHKMMLFNHLQALLGRNITWLMGHHGSIEDTGRLIEYYSKDLSVLKKSLKTFTTDEMNEEMLKDMELFKVNKDLQAVAQEIVSLRLIKTALDIIFVSKESKRNAEDAAKAFNMIGDVLHIRWLVASARRFVPKQYLQILAVRTLINELHNIQMKLTEGELKLSKTIANDLNILKGKEKKFIRLNNYMKELKTGDAEEVFVSKLTMAIKYLREVASH